MLVTIAHIRNEFETDGTVLNIRRHRTSTDNERSEDVLKKLEHSPRKSVRQAARKTGVSK